MMRFKDTTLVIFSISLFAFPLFNLILGEQPVRAEKWESTSDPITVYTYVVFCNGTSVEVNSAFGFQSGRTAWSWRTLKPGDCHWFSRRENPGRVNFFVASKNIIGDARRPAFQRPVSSGRNCYRYVVEGNRSNLVDQRCPDWVYRLR